MYITEVLYNEVDIGQYKFLIDECSRFLDESQGIPLYKTLPISTQDVNRIKVRHKKNNNKLSEAFTEAFKTNVREKSIFTSAKKPSIIEEDKELFYVFPTNNYKCLYSTEIHNSQTEYKVVCEALFEHYTDEQEAVSIISEMLKISYTNQNLCEGLYKEAEIMIYGIPAYYAVRESSIAYDDLMYVLNK